MQVSALSEELGVSPITVRRDIAALDRERLVEQVHGGARLAQVAPASAQSESTVDSSSARPVFAMVVPSLRYYWPTIVQGATTAAQRLGVDLAVHASTANAEANLLIVEQIISGDSVDALIIAPELRAGSTSDRLIELLSDLPIPVILAERGVEGHGRLNRLFDTVRTDHSLGAAMAVRHLVGLGHRSIAYEGDPFSPTDPFLRAGYERAVRLLGLEGTATPARTLNPHGKHPFEEIDAALQRYAASGSTAVLIHSDVAATLLLQHATRRGLKIPEELSLIAYDDELSVTTKPALTAVAPAKEALGERTVELALNRLNVPDAPGEHVLLHPSLQVRDSTAELP